MSSIDVEQLFRKFASVDMKIDKFKQICQNAWRNKYGYLVIDLTRDFESGFKYREKLIFDEEN